MPGDKQYCMCCGEQVPVARIPKEGRVEMACVYCGFVLDSEILDLSQPPIPDESEGAIAPGVKPEPVSPVKAEEPPIPVVPAPEVREEPAARPQEASDLSPVESPAEESPSPVEPESAPVQQSGGKADEEPLPKAKVRFPLQGIRPSKPIPATSKGKPSKMPSKGVRTPPGRLGRPMIIPKSFRSQIPGAPPPAAPRPAAEGPVTSARCILAADDAELTRDLLKGMLLKSGLSKEVIMTSDGQEFVQAYTKRVVEDRETDVVILDIQMPIMDGITAARVMRAVEAQYQKKPVSIIFFSAMKCDEPLRKQLAIFSPASYINKGSDSDPARLMERIERLIGYILARRRARTL